jgi:hypothetical protein
LQDSFNKYSEDNFVFDTLEECDEEFIYSQENHWCNMLNSHNRLYGYNIDPTSPIGKVSISDETKARMSAGAEKRPVYVYTIYGEFFRQFSDLYKCGEYFNTAAGNIHRKMNILFNKRYLIDSLLTKHIVKDEHISIEPVVNYWSNIFSKIKECNGEYKVYDCFNNYIGTASSKDLSDILNVDIRTISAAVLRQTYLRTLKLIK